MSKNPNRKSEVESTVGEVRQLYSRVRSVERTANRAIQMANLMGAAFPGLALLGPYGFAAMFAFQVAAFVSQQVTAAMKADMEQRFEEERRVMLAQVYAGLNERDRALYRELVAE